MEQLRAVDMLVASQRLRALYEARNAAVPRSSGQDQALAWCDDLVALFIAQQFGAITCRTPSPPIGNNADNDRGKYWIMSVSVPYFRDFFA